MSIVATLGPGAPIGNSGPFPQYIDRRELGYNYSGLIIAQGAFICDAFWRLAIDVKIAPNHQYSVIDVETTCEVGTAGSNIVGVYSAVEVKNGAGKGYGMNPVLVIDAGGANLGIGCEIDVNNNGTASLNVEGIVLNGNSATSPQHGIVIQAVGATWNEGVEIGNYNTYGLFILRPTGTAKAILVWNSSNAFSFSVAPRGTIGTSQSGAKIALAQAITTKAITWAIAEPDTNYEVYASTTYSTTIFVTAKTTSGCTINFGTATPDANQTLDVTLMRADAN